MRARAAALLLFALLALTVSLAARESGADGASAEPPAETPRETHFVPELGLPATEVVAFGAAPGEAPKEAWAYGYLGEVPPAGEPEQVDRYTLLEHAADGTWQRVPLPVGPAGEVAKRPDTFPLKLGALAGQSTPAGAVALLTDVGIVLRDPAGAPRLVPPPSGAGLLGEGESLPPQVPPEGAPTPYAVYDPAPGKGGLLIAPYGDGAQGEAPVGGEAPPGGGPGVLDYDGAEWTREPIEAGGEPVRPLAIDCGPTTSAPQADSGEGCWLLAGVGKGGGRLVLFRRGPAPSGEEGGGDEGKGGAEGTPEGGEEPVVGGEDPPVGGAGPTAMSWTPVSVEGGLLGGQSAPSGGGEPAGGNSLAALPGNAQMLTVTGQGVWVDFQVTLAAGGPSSATELVEPTGSGAGGAPSTFAAKVADSWCYPTGPGCESSLGAAFPAAYRSFAWPGASAEDPGRRIVTGLPGRATLELSGGTFTRAAGAGGSPGIAPGGAAFASPELGFVADGINPDTAPDGAGQSQAIAVTVEPPAAQTAVEPVPFRQPLNAVAMNPDGNGEAIAVGAGTEFARFVPGSGWRQDPVEFVDEEEGSPNFNARGNPGESILGVAWPTSERAYAVGAGGGFWTWTTATGSWKPMSNKVEAPINGIAFSAADPSRVFAVGSPNIFRLNNPDRWGADVDRPPVLGASETSPVFTSVAFAGNEAITTWHQGNTETGAQSGGVWVENGSGWQVEPAVEQMISGLPGPSRWPTKVAGLPDGGAIVAGPGFVIKRESGTAPWQFSAEPLPEAGNIAALAAYRDASGAVRSVVAVDLGPRREVHPTVYGGTKEPLPASGYLLRETGDGWSDLEHAALPVEEGSAAMPRRPEPALALAVSEDGESMLAVGGQTGAFDTSTEPKGTEYETAAAIRLPATAALDPDQPAPIARPGGRPTIAIGAQAACAAPCADQAAAGFAPDTLLPHALATARERLAAGPGEMRAFLYAGGRLESEAGAPGYEAELNRLASLFTAAGALPLLTAPSADLLAGGETPFTTAFSGFGPTAGSTPYYAFRSEVPGGAPLAVMVLDLSTGALGSAQETWLRKELAAAKEDGVTAVAVGDASPGFTLPDPPAGVEPPAQMQDPDALASILTEGGAAAYFFDYPGADVLTVLTDGERAVLAIGTGALGYGKPGPGAEDWLGSSGFLLAEVESPPQVGQPTGVLVRAIPDIASLTMHGGPGEQIAAGEAEIFEGLGRLPEGGIRVDQSGGAAVFEGPEPYVTFPFPSQSLSCQGDNCPFAVSVEYAFSSSDPEVGDFVTPGGQPDTEGRRATDPRSGFFCAKSPGTTTVSLTAGGLTYSEPVTVTEGEIGEGCRLPELLFGDGQVMAVEPAPSEPAPEAPPPPVVHHVTPQPLPLPGHAPTPTPAHHSPPQAHHVPQAPTPTPSTTPSAPAPHAIRPVVSPHPPPAVEPAPPTGVSPQPAAQPGTQPVGQAANAPAPSVVPAPGVAPGRVSEEEAAIQQGHLAVRVGHATAAPAAFRAGSGSGSPAMPLAGALGAAALLALAGGAGVAAFGRGHRRAFATASLTRRNHPRR
ncbi:MAG TPA: hypothetical protein VHZ54_07140 [Solirubrobacterales bacterium]|nr:hypothetical protein [Solirubrobacterales bacterium]